MNREKLLETLEVVETLTPAIDKGVVALERVAAVFGASGLTVMGSDFDGIARDLRSIGHRIDARLHQARGRIDDGTSRGAI